MYTAAPAKHVAERIATKSNTVDIEGAFTGALMITAASTVL
jgi:hypothetical protein